MVEKVPILELVLEGSAAPVKKATAEAEKDIKALPGKIKPVASALQGIFIGIGIGIANAIGKGIRSVAGGFKAAFDNAVNFQSRMAEVSTLGVENLGRLEQGVLSLSSAFGQELGKTVEGVYQAISAGVPEGDVLGFLRTASKASTAGITTLDVAVKAISQTINAYDMDFGEALKVSDAFFTTVKFGITRFEDLSKVTGTFLPLGKSLGVTLKESMAAMAALTKAGLDTPRAATALRGMFSGIIRNADEATKDLLKKDGLLAVINSLADFDELFPDIEGKTGALILSSASAAKTVAEAMAEMTDATSETMEAAALIEDTFKFQFDKLFQTISNVGTEIASPLAEVGTAVLKEIMRWFEEPQQVLGTGEAGWTWNPFLKIYEKFNAEFDQTQFKASMSPKTFLKKMTDNWAKIIGDNLEEAKTEDGGLNISKFFADTFNDLRTDPQIAQGLTSISAVIKKALGAMAQPGSEVVVAAGKLGASIAFAMGKEILFGIGNAISQAVQGIGSDLALIQSQSEGSFLPAPIPYDPFVDQSTGYGQGNQGQNVDQSLNIDTINAGGMTAKQLVEELQLMNQTGRNPMTAGI